MLIAVWNLRPASCFSMNKTKCVARRAVWHACPRESNFLEKNRLFALKTPKKGTISVLKVLIYTLYGWHLLNGWGKRQGQAPPLPSLCSDDNGSKIYNSEKNLDTQKNSKYNSQNYITYLIFNSIIGAAMHLWFSQYIDGNLRSIESLIYIKCKITVLIFTS